MNEIVTLLIKSSIQMTSREKIMNINIENVIIKIPKLAIMNNIFPGLVIMKSASIEIT